MPLRHVVIGGGPAGLFAIETIRARDPEAQITLVSDEPPYSRMVLPYYIAGEIPEGHVYTGNPAYWERLGTTVVTGTRATAIEPDRGRVALSAGASVAFDRLLLATGSSPVRPDIPGATGERVHHLWTLADAQRTLAVIGGRKRRVVFIGAGFIGFIVLNALAKIGCELAVVEVEGQILPRMLDAEAASLARGWLEGRGIAVHTGVRAVEIGEAGGDKAVRLSSGATLRGDLVVMAIGVRPNVELATASGIRTDHGILVDHHLQTSVPHVYAAGDCAQGPDLSTGQPAVHAIQPTAVEHGRVAGANMAGRPTRYAGSLAMNVLDVVGLQCASFGLWRGDGSEATPASVVVHRGRPLYRKLVWDGDRVVGAILLGPAEDVGLLNDLGMIKGLIQTQAGLGPWAKGLRANPMDIRRAFVAAGTPGRLLDRTLLGRPLENQRHRFGDRAPARGGERTAEVREQIKLEPTRGKGGGPREAATDVVMD